MKLKRKLILSLLILGLCSAGSGVGRTQAIEDGRLDDEEYAAYSALIAALVRERRRGAGVVVINHRTTAFSKPHYMSGMSLTETFESFKIKNAGSYKLEKRFDLKIDYALAREEEGLRLDGKLFAERYPQGFGTLLLSRAGLNREKTEALVYVEERLLFGGRADGYTLRKTEGVWRVSRSRLFWIS